MLTNSLLRQIALASPRHVDAGYVAGSTGRAQLLIDGVADRPVGAPRRSMTRPDFAA
jgi:hypothetical protein